MFHIKDHILTFQQCRSIYQILLSSEIKAGCHSTENNLHLPHENRLKFEQCDDL